MATKKRESSRIEDPMKSVKVGNKYPYENIIQDLGFKKQIRYTSKHAMQHYQHTTGCSNEEALIYKDVIEEYFKRVSTEMIQRNYPYLWYRIGEFFIAKFNGSPMLNAYQSMKHKQLVSYVNLHTSGWIYQFYWAKARTVFFNNSVYEFKPCEGIPEICGKKGLKFWIRKLHADNSLTDYNAFIRNHAMVWKRRKKREAEAALKKEKQSETFKNLLK